MSKHHIEMVWMEIVDSHPLQKIPVTCTGSVCPELSNSSSGFYENSDSLQRIACFPDPDNIHEQIKQLLLIPITILILVSNLGVLALLAGNKIFHTPAYLLVSNLSLADLMVGLVSIGTMVTKANEKSLDVCLVRTGFTIACCIASLMCLMCIAIERYIAISYPLTYKQNVTILKVFVIIALSWLLSLVVGFAPLIGWAVESYNQYCSFLYVLPDDYILFLFISCVLLPIVITCSIYGLLYRHARFHIKRIEAVENLHLDRRNNGILGFSPRTLKSFKTFLTVFGCVIVTWLPFLLTTVAQIISGDTTCFLKDIIGTHLLLLGFTNSFLNPIIYAIRTKDFRNKVRDTLGRRVTLCHST